MNEEELINYYNKFNEDKRLKTRHGKIEFITTMKYIKETLSQYNNPHILDIGAGCGAYSIPLAKEGYNITALELVKHNLKVIEKNCDLVQCIQGNAKDLSQFKDQSFDVIFIFGPMYHLITEEEKILVLEEAKRVLKDNGTILVSYIMNEYAVITHAFKEKNILTCLDKLDANFHIISDKKDLYSYSRLEDIDRLNNITNLKRIKIVANDTIANYFREYINKLEEEEFNYFIKYHLAICERKDIIGLSTHTLDIIKKKK